MLRGFARDDRGAIAIVFALVIALLLGVIGAAIDFSRAQSVKSHLQAVVDAATLAAAHGESQSEKEDIFKKFIASNAAADNSLTIVSGSESLTPGGGLLTGTAAATMETTFARLLHVNEMTIDASASVRTMDTTAEIVLVLDVSSSMIEEGRFAPMQDAARTFIQKIAAATGNLSNVDMAIVPFSSRINVGLQNTSFLAKWNGNPAVPDRWTNPDAHYSSSYSRVGWIDATNFAMYNGKNYYWMGCVEPRVDVAIHTGTSINPALGEGPPTNAKFIAQDYNTQSGQSFCPPPVVPLRSDATALESAIGKLTSQGTTRLDAGMIGGWYALSPKWKNTWTGGTGPELYTTKDHRKIVVFMTDGKMNTADDPSGKHFDWVCEVGGDCDDYANDKLVDICSAMKSEGIVIYSVAYDEDADQTHIKACATSDDYFFEATSAVGTSYITGVYQHIAEQIVNDDLALVR